MTDRVDAPGGMVREEDADESTPEQRGESTADGTDEEPSGDERNGERQRGEHREEPGRDAQVAVDQEIGGIASPSGRR